MPDDVFELHPETGDDFRSLRAWLSNDPTLTDATVTVGRPGGEEQRGLPDEVALWLNVIFAGGGFGLTLTTSLHAWLQTRPAGTHTTIKHGDSEVSTSRELPIEEINSTLERMQQPQQRLKKGRGQP